MSERRKPGPKTDPNAIAQILVDAALLGDEAAAKRHTLSVRTIERYRAKSLSDRILSELVASKIRAAEGQWADGLAIAIKGQIAFLTKASQSANAADPSAIHSIAGALKILADVALTSKMLDARLARITGAEGAPAGSSAGADPPPAVH
jgi:hypothetical protein